MLEALQRDNMSLRAATTTTAAAPPPPPPSALAMAFRCGACLQIALQRFLPSRVAALLLRFATPLAMDGVAIHASGIVGGGLGLFATRDFARGDKIATCRGLFRDGYAAHNAPLHEKRYMMRLGKGVSIVIMSAAGYANDHAVDLCRNARFARKSPATLSADVVATKPITCGDEIYVEYGARYWRSSPTPLGGIEEPRCDATRVAYCR